jgi:glutamyl-tRNA reductase
MNDLRFALVGAGFWARFQLAGWRQSGCGTCVAICDRSRAKAEVLAHDFGIARIYADAEEMVRNEKLDVLDIVASVEAHAPRSVVRVPLTQLFDASAFGGTRFGCRSQPESPGGHALAAESAAAP